MILWLRSKVDVRWEAAAGVPVMDGTGRKWLDIIDVCGRNLIEQEGAQCQDGICGCMDRVRRQVWI